MAQPTREQGRREAVRRVQFGLFGLGGVLLLVTLTNVIVENVRKDGGLAPANPTAAGAVAGAPVSNTTAQPTEPFADLGVTPSSDAGAAGAKPDGTGVVPDLQPDPHLQKPMDQDPARSNR